MDNTGLSALLACHHLLYSSCHPQLKVELAIHSVIVFCLIFQQSALQFDEREQTSPSFVSSSSRSNSTTELILPSTAVLFHSKTEDGVNMRMSPTPSNTSLLLVGKSPITEVLSLPLLHSAHTTIINPIHEQPPVNTTMVKFTSLSSTLMSKGKLNICSFEQNILSNNFVPSDDQMNIQLTSSDVELEEQPMVLESVGSQDELIALQTSPGAEVSKSERSKDSFCSSGFGPIISAAQSTALLYSATELTGSLLMDNCSSSSQNSQINLHGNGFDSVFCVCLQSCSNVCLKYNRFQLTQNKTCIFTRNGLLVLYTAYFTLSGKSGFYCWFPEPVVAMALLE